MKNHVHHHDHNCTHCSCNNPVLKIFDGAFEDLITPPKSKQNTQKQEDKLKGESVIITTLEKETGNQIATIRPLIDGDVKTTVEAIGIHNGMVVCTGNKSTVRQKMIHATGLSPTEIEKITRVLEPGQTLLPGFWDPHVHIVLTCAMEGWIDVSPFDGQNLKNDYNIAFLKEKITNSQNHLKEYNYWLLCRDADPSLMKFEVNESGLNELTTFNLEKMDGINNENPLCMQSASKHTFYINTKATKRIFELHKDNSKFEATFKTNEDKEWNFDTFCKNTNGQLQELDEMQWVYAEDEDEKRAIPDKQLGEVFAKNRIMQYIDEYIYAAASNGITSLYDAGLNDLQVNALDNYINHFIKVSENKEFPVGIGGAMIVEDKEGAEGLGKFDPKNLNTQNIYIANVKVVYDGSNQGLTGYQSEKYKCDAALPYGLTNYNDISEYQSMINTLVKNGWSLMIHANGNRAVEETISAIETAINTLDLTSEEDKEKFRHRIEHCSILEEGQIKRMYDSGISPSFLIGHVGYWGWVFQQAIFEGKAEKLDLCKSALERKLRITLHSDCSVSPIGSLRLMEQSITRRMEEAPKYAKDHSGNYVLNSNECLTPEQALRAVTYDAAWQCHNDKSGSLASTFDADFVILEQDPITMPSNEIYLNMRKIPVIETWKGGTLVYERNK